MQTNTLVLKKKTSKKTTNDLQVSVSEMFPSNTFLRIPFSSSPFPSASASLASSKHLLVLRHFLFHRPLYLLQLPQPFPRLPTPPLPPHLLGHLHLLQPSDPLLWLHPLHPLLPFL